MELDFDLCHRAIATRDPRFDGRFFTGVLSTKIYCRPVCPARTPRRDRCVFFEHAAQAAAAGFRPCQRCRPESAPNTPAWRGSSTTVSRALALIAEGALDEDDVPRLADRLGVGDRHLRRLFRRELGVSPLQIAQTRRVHLGRRLLRDSDLPVGEVAAAVGYASERRFRDAVRRAFDQSPTEIRRRRPRRDASSALRLSLGFRPPLDWNRICAFLQRRQIPEIESVADGVYSRVIEATGEVGVARVQHRPEAHALSLELPAAAAGRLRELVDGFRRHFDLDCDPQAISACLDQDPLLRKLLGRHGLPRVLGGSSPFEMAVRAVVGQQISVEAATTVCRRLVRRCGRRVSDGERLNHLFPEPEAILETDLDGVGLTLRRTETLRAVARAAVERPEWLRLGPDLDTRIAQWRGLPGIGEWTAQILAMRALRDPDAFPATDLGVRKALASRGELCPGGRARERARRWRPFRAYATALLWEKPESRTPAKGNR